MEKLHDLENLVDKYFELHGPVDEEFKEFIKLMSVYLTFIARKPLHHHVSSSVMGLLCTKREIFTSAPRRSCIMMMSTVCVGVVFLKINDESVEMYWEEQIKSFLEDEKRLTELLKESNALESLKNVEDAIVQYNHNFGHLTGYIKFEEVRELDADEQAEESEEYLYQYMKRTNELSSEIKKLQTQLKKMRKDWLEELEDLE